MILADRQQTDAIETSSSSFNTDRQALCPEIDDGKALVDGRTASELIEHAVGLLSQQAWCWGQDILRPEGNWLLEIGFQRLRPPANRKDCSSVYVVQLPRGRCVVLRGFGVFYGDEARGGVFLPRYEFQPRYTPHATLDCPPWSDLDLPKLDPPSDSQRHVCAALTLDLIDWIRNYEVTVAKHLGIEYRGKILTRWNNGKRPFTPAEKFASAWRELSFQVAANFNAYSRRDQP